MGNDYVWASREVVIWYDALKYEPGFNRDTLMQQHTSYNQGVVFHPSCPWTTKEVKTC